MSADVVIIDYGVGNVGSVLNMFRHSGANAVVSSSHAEISTAKRLVLPGVGSFDHGMNMLRERDLSQLIVERALIDKIPILGICLGLQLFSRRSEEGNSCGLGLLKADSVRFVFKEGHNRLKVPHVGWNTVTPTPGFDLIPEGGRFYFVHSYHVEADDPAEVAGTTTYGLPFSSVLRSGNIIGVQFHPEKSLRAGMALLGRFARL